MTHRTTLFLIDKIIMDYNAEDNTTPFRQNNSGSRHRRQHYFITDQIIMDLGTEDNNISCR